MPIPQSQWINVECAIHGTISAAGSNARSTVNTFHFFRNSGALPITMAHLDAIFQASIAIPFAAALNARWVQTFNTMRVIDDATFSPVTFVHALPGLIAGDSMPMTNTAFILLKSNLRGKRYRGSKKIGPLSESDTTSGTDDILNVAALARFTAIANAIVLGFTDADGNGWNSSIVSRQPPSQLLVNPTTVVANQVINALARKSIGRLRKREPKSVY